MTNKQDISKLRKIIEENFNVDISMVLKNDFCLACYFSLVDEKEASLKMLKNVFDVVGWDKRKTYFFDIQNSIDEHAVVYAEKIFANTEIINLIEKLVKK